MIEPARRFAKEFDVSEDVWRQCWVKYKVLELTIPELCEYIHIKTGRKPSHISISRWVTRTEIYAISREAIKKGAETVVSSFFREYEEQVINELLKNIKTSVSKESRSIV